MPQCDEMCNKCGTTEGVCLVFNLCDACKNEPKEDKMDEMPRDIWVAENYQGKGFANSDKLHKTDVKYTRADLASQKQPEMKGNDVCLSETGNNALDALVNNNKLSPLGKEALGKTIRTALEQAEQDREAVRDLELALYKYMSAGYKEKRKEAADFAKAVKKTHAEAIKRAEEN
jgi:hypothetical protein